MIAVDFPVWVRIVLAVIGAGIVFSCLCRARHMTASQTASAIRGGTTILATSGFILMLTAILRPDWLIGSLVSISASALIVQATSAKYWRRGMPEQFKATQ